MKKMMMVIVILMFTVSFAQAAEITLAWDANAASENVEGYKIWDVEQDSMTQLINVIGGDSTTTTVTLSEDKCHYLTITAYRGNLSSQPYEPPLEWCPETVLTVPAIEVQGAPSTVIQLQINMN